MGRAFRVTALLVLGACTNEPQRLTDPSRPDLRFEAQAQGVEGTDVLVCVSNDSPAGNYTFTVSDIEYASGGSTVPGTNPAVVGPDGCFTLVSRLIPADESDPSADPVTTVTYSYTGNDVVGGAGYAGTACVDDAGIPASSPCGTTVVAHVNFVAGTVATFSFISSAQMIEALRVTISNLDISKGTEHSLDDMLSSALKAIAKGQSSRACNQLDHFIKEVSGSKKIGSADAATIFAKTSDIQIAVGC